MDWVPILYWVGYFFTVVCRHYFFFELYFIYLLYSRFLLVIYFIHISVYMSIPISQFIPPPSAAFPPWCPYVCSLHLCLYFCVQALLCLLYKRGNRNSEHLTCPVLHTYRISEPDLKFKTSGFHLGLIPLFHISLSYA